MKILDLVLKEKDMNYTTTEDSEAAHLCEIYDDGNSSYEDFIAEREQGVAHDERHYKLNKKAKVGTRIVCAGPKCNNRFIKKSYQQCFCCTRHKDQFWNRREAHFGYRKPIQRISQKPEAMKKTDCQFYCKGGWCGKCHDEVVEITRNYVSKRIVCVRCSELHHRWKDKCDYYQLRKQNKI